MTASNRTTKRPQKKTDMLEVRVSPEEKQAFLDACRRVGRSASAVIRDAMRAYAQFGPMARQPGRTTMIVSAFAGAALGAWALNAAFHPEGDEERVFGAVAFGRFDIDADRVLTLDEMQRVRESVRAVLTPPEGGERNPSWYGQVGGLLIAHGLDSIRFTREPDTIGAECWVAVEAYFDVYQADSFRRWDANGNGVVTAQEFSAHKAASLRYSFRSGDRNGDGFLSPEDTNAEVSDDLRAELRHLHERIYGGDRAEPPVDLDVACAAEAELPRMLPAYDGSTSENLERYREAVAQQRNYQDLDQDGRVSFEEYLALHGAN